jgi:uncharacterized protein (DUF4415 family)
MAKYKRPMTTEEMKKATDADIDFSDIPELDDSFWRDARIVTPAERKGQITLRLDADLLDWFRSQGKGYQTHMNAVLRSYYEARSNTPPTDR